jgi:hypothetical protein
MASLVLKMSISLDGYVASADGSGDWKAAGRSDDSANRAPSKIRPAAGGGCSTGSSITTIRTASPVPASTKATGR